MIQKIGGGGELQPNGIGILKPVEEANRPIGIYGPAKSRHIQPGWELHATLWIWASQWKLLSNLLKGHCLEIYACVFSESSFCTVKLGGFEAPTHRRDTIRDENSC
jgi:hypothetical protein